MKFRGLLLTLVVAHVAGSYGTEFVDACENYGAEVPAWDRWIAPARGIFWLVRETYRQQSVGLVPFWIGYLLPFCTVVAVRVLLIAGRTRPPSRGFEVLPR